MEFSTTDIVVMIRLKLKLNMSFLFIRSSHLMQTCTYRSHTLPSSCKCNMDTSGFHINESP